MALFLLGGVAFSALSPTGYLPTLLAGALFPWWLAWPLAYTVANLGALCNLVLVRGPCHPLARRVVAGHARLQKASGFGGFGWLDAELRREGEGAYRVVALVRLPGLWSGLFNYVFALSSVRGKAYIVGNLLGMAPGALIFSRLGSYASPCIVPKPQRKPRLMQREVVASRQAQSLLAALASTSHTPETAQVLLLCAELVFLAAASAALGLHFRRVWRAKAAEAARNAPSAEYEERVSLLPAAGGAVDVTEGPGGEVLEGASGLDEAYFGGGAGGRGGGADGRPQDHPT